jgi:hypothetical protein
MLLTAARSWSGETLKFPDHYREFRKLVLIVVFIESVASHEG